jgi:hypothetical protein
MAKPRSANLHVFLTSVQSATLLRFFDGVGLTEAAERWLHMEPDHFFSFADLPANAEKCEPILETLEQVAETCGEGGALIVRAYRRYGLSFDEQQAPAELAMLLYLDHRFAFEFARSKYLLYGGGTTLSVYGLAAETVTTGEVEIAEFRDAIAAWFVMQDKGSQCIVSHFEDGEEFVLLVQRGSYIETRPVWEGETIAVSTQRPAIEDVLTWDRESNELRIKTAYARDRDQYLNVFARHFCGNERLADRAREEAIFTLEPLRLGRFRYAGKGPIKRVELREVRLQLHGVSRGILTLRAHRHFGLLQAPEDVLGRVFLLVQPGGKALEDADIAGDSLGGKHLRAGRDTRVVEPLLRDLEVANELPRAGQVQLPQGSALPGDKAAEPLAVVEERFLGLTFGPAGGEVVVHCRL